MSRCDESSLGDLARTSPAKLLVELFAVAEGVTVARACERVVVVQGVGQATMLDDRRAASERLVGRPEVVPRGCPYSLAPGLLLEYIGCHSVLLLFRVQTSDTRTSECRIDLEKRSWLFASSGRIEVSTNNIHFYTAFVCSVRIAEQSICHLQQLHICSHPSLSLRPLLLFLCQRNKKDDRATQEPARRTRSSAR